MSKQIQISEESYKKLQAALMLTGEEEETVLNKLIKEYAHRVFEGVVGKKGDEPKAIESKHNAIERTAEEQKRLFVNWFRSLTRNGKPYNPVTISGYTGRLENACCEQVFAEIPVVNLFEITDLNEFLHIQKRLKACDGYYEFDAKSHNGFTAALRKYEEFLRYQSGEDTIRSAPVSSKSYSQPANVHRWTMEEDMICCKKFLECYVVNQSNIDTVQFLKMLAKEVPEVSEGSLRMKIQNIKYLSERAGIKNTCTLRWLSQYSMQCERAFYQVLKEMNIR